MSRRLPDAPPGLTVLRLDAHALARSNDLTDVRIVDARGRQVPYLVEPRSEVVVVGLRLPARKGNRRSVYAVPLPYATWPEGAKLVLTTPAGVFERHVTVRRSPGSHRERRSTWIASSPWRNDRPDAKAPRLEMPMPSRAQALEIVVDEGDNAPLPLASASIHLPARALRFDHPGTELFLVYGNRRVAAPRYDIALLASKLSGATAREMTLPSGPVVEREEDRSAKKLFWAGIVVAAVVLTALLLRLVLVRPETSRAPNDTT